MLFSPRTSGAFTLDCAKVGISVVLELLLYVFLVWLEGVWEGVGILGLKSAIAFPMGVFSP